MKDRILHEGVVKRVLDNQLIVTVLQQSSCDTCQARNACRISETKEWEIIVPVNKGVSYSVGDSVCVSMQAGLGFKAVWLTFGYPLLIVLLCVILVKLLGGSDLLAVAVLLGAEFLWYAILFLFRRKLENNYKFKIEN